MAATKLLPNAEIAASQRSDFTRNVAIRKQVDGKLLGLRVNRYSWWVHWRELADYILPRRYKWLITPNQMSRGSPINQHILDSTGSLAARNLASGMMSGITNPSRPWFRLKIGRVDSTLTSPTSLWLKECERLMNLVFAESNFYNAMAVFYLDLVVFGTAVLLIYEDFDDVIACYNPCLGEFYVENSDKLKVDTMYREFTLTVSQVVQKFGLENTSSSVQNLYNEGSANLTKEIIVAHAIEPNDDGRDFGIPEMFKFREVYWEWSASTPQSSPSDAILRKSGFHESPAICARWDIVSNDSYGRSPTMDAYPDIRQLQQETKRKGQGIDRMVNPPLIADMQLKNSPASLLPGGVTYVAGQMQGAKPGMSSVYGDFKPAVREMMEDIQDIRERIKDALFNKLFMAVSSLEGDRRTATEIDARRNEQLVMLGPVLERIYDEGIKPIIERVFSICARAHILPPPPAELQGQNINIEFISMLNQAQNAASASGIERLLGLAGNLAGVDPGVLDNIDIDFALDKYSDSLNNDPRLIRSPEDLANIRQRREKEQQLNTAAQATPGLAKAASVLADLGGQRGTPSNMAGG
jgi:Bacteriophage head to tail connecting protein